MRQSLIIFLLISVSLMSVYSQSPEEMAAAWDKHRISRVLPSDARHGDLKKYLDQLRSLNVRVDEVGRSFGGREIYQVEWGKGPAKVFMWSQMHGDEPTATSSLVDMFAFLQQNRHLEWVKQIEERVMIRAVPMLNPDGAELFVRRNLQGIDINRDAIDLVTPEARLLKKLRDDWSPIIGFNLHNQQSLTMAGRTFRQAAISLLVVYGDAEKTTSEGHERNKRLSGAMVQALQKFIPGHIGRYDDGWTPTAFGDNFSAWGTPTILIETGALHGRDEMYLVKMNFIALLTALHSFASGSERMQDPKAYLSLPENASGGLNQFVFRRANVVDIAAGGATVMADIGVNAQRRRSSFATPHVIRGMGDLLFVRGLDEYDASGFNVVQRFGRMKPGELAEFYFYRRDRTIDWMVSDLVKQFPPDAIFSLGKWIEGEGKVPKAVSK